MSDPLLSTQIHRLWDFWRRGESVLGFSSEYQAFGFPIAFSANHGRLLEGATISAGRFSHCEPQGEQGRIRLSVVIDERLPLTAVPPDWPERLRHFAVGPWLTINAEPWVNAFAHLNDRCGVALVSAAMLDHPYLYSRFILDSFVLNMIMRNGLGQLHASCVYRNGVALLLCATHNSGKSTTALRLALAGYSILTDGMTYVRVGESGIELLGYPVGEAKLRLDTLDKFPDLQGHGMDVMVREDKKMVFNLRRLLPTQVLEGPVRPRRTVLCLMERTGQLRSHVEPIGRQAALEELLPEITHLDEPQVMLNNIGTVQALLDQARIYRLFLGTDESHILTTLEAL